MRKVKITFTFDGQGKKFDDFVEGSKNEILSGQMQKEFKEVGTHNNVNITFEEIKK